MEIPKECGEPETDLRGFVPLPTLRLLIFLMSLYQTISNHLFIGITLLYNEKETIQSIIQDYITILKRTVSYLSETQRPHSSCKFYKLVKDMF